MRSPVASCRFQDKAAPVAGNGELAASRVTHG
jgi:hypothetical protein